MANQTTRCVAGRMILCRAAGRSRAAGAADTVPLNAQWLTNSTHLNSVSTNGFLLGLVHTEDLLLGSTQRASSWARHRGPPLGLDREPPLRLGNWAQVDSSQARYTRPPFGLGTEGRLSARRRSDLLYLNFLKLLRGSAHSVSSEARQSALELSFSGK